MKKIILLLISTFLFFSCDSNERNIKKVFKRLNTGETAAASKYIWPEDHKNLYTFEQRFLQNQDLVSLDLLSVEKIEDDNKTAYQVNLNCNNCNDELLNYFKNRKNLISDTKITDTLYVKTANEKGYVTFDWKLQDANVSDNLKLSSILTKKINLRSGPGMQFEVTSQLESGDELVIDDNYTNPKWRKGLIFDNVGKVQTVYFSSKLSDRKDISFFTLNWTDSMGILVITLIAILVLFVVYPLLFGALFRMGGEGGAVFGFILFFVLLIAIYFTYQIIETAVFELFIVDLPF